MLNLTCSSRERVTTGYSPTNWEADVCDVVVEACDVTEDPSGYRVVFYKDEAMTEAVSKADNSYSVGASFLKSRLRNLSRAGFDAPMTKKAMNVIDKKRLIRAF